MPGMMRTYILKWNTKKFIQLLRFNVLFSSIILDRLIVFFSSVFKIWSAIKILVRQNANVRLWVSKWKTFLLILVLFIKLFWEGLLHQTWRWASCLFVLVIYGEILISFGSELRLAKHEIRTEACYVASVLFKALLHFNQVLCWLMWFCTCSCFMLYWCS